MSFSRSERQIPYATSVRISNVALTVDLIDGRTISAPIVWYPRLDKATAKERKSWRFVGRGIGIHWPEIDEDVSVANLLDGQPSAESPASFKKWLEQRNATRSKKSNSKKTKS